MKLGYGGTKQESPPRMRGKLNGKEYELAEDRITPADAGKTYRAFVQIPCR